MNLHQHLGKLTEIIRVGQSPERQGTV
jgi:hypothetical protein